MSKGGQGRGIAQAILETERFGDLRFTKALVSLVGKQGPIITLMLNRALLQTEDLAYCLLCFQSVSLTGACSVESQARPRARELPAPRRAARGLKDSQQKAIPHGLRRREFEARGEGEKLRHRQRGQVAGRGALDLAGP